MIKKLVIGTAIGVALSGIIATPAAANAGVSVQAHGFQRYVLIRGTQPNNAYYVTLSDGERATAFYTPRKVWVPSGCIVWKDGHVFDHALDGDGHWKTFDFQVSEADFRIDCPNS